jgi:hypothetical protein
VAAADSTTGTVGQQTYGSVDQQAIDFTSDLVVPDKSATSYTNTYQQQQPSAYSQPSAYNNQVRPVQSHLPCGIDRLEWKALREFCDFREFCFHFSEK